MPPLVPGIGFWLAAIILITPRSSPAQTFSGVGERAQGMAGAFVAVADDASAVYWNPAALAWPTGSTFDAQFGMAEDSTFFGVGLPPLGLSYYRLPIVSASANRQNEGSGKAEIRPSATHNVGVTINQTVVNGLVIGTTLRLVHGGFEDQPDRTTVDLDLGTIYARGSFRAGLTARNLAAPEFHTGDGPFALSRQVRAGVAFAPRVRPAGVHGPFTVAFDADLTRTAGFDGDLRDAAVGTEYWFGRGQVGARAGLRWSTLNDPDPAVSGGITVALPHSAFVEGHLTKKSDEDDPEWGAGFRFTF
ncbi:MAG: conjugal transfer protein TraF [Vicinamibacterales bacterium]|nr:conjugal transfer protein TraF [Vicinamibacterales bacterium]